MVLRWVTLAMLLIGLMPLSWASIPDDAFGTRNLEYGDNSDVQRANTKEEDPTGILNEGFRYRCLETGVFLTRDPAGFVDGPNLYTYVRQNPWTYYDPKGLYIESAWDIASLGMGVASFASNVRQGNVGSALLDAGGIVVDGLAVALPLVPGGAGAGIKAGRAIDKGLDALNTANKVEKATDAGKAVDKATDVATDANKANKAAQKTTPSGTASCFPVGTLVWTISGAVAIEELQVGDWVIAYSFDKEDIAIRPILETVSNFTYYWVDIEINGEIITTTRSHLFWVESEQDWIKAKDLQPGMMVLLADGSEAKITLVTFRELDVPEDTFNLEVDIDHNYFVGFEQVLVHNGTDDKAPKPKEGIYEFPDKKNPGQDYVGQSGNMDSRLKTHERKGRLEPGTESRTEVPGGTTQREIAEHKKIQEKTGGVPAKDSDAVSNKKDPIGKNRQHLLEGGCG